MVHASTAARPADAFACATTAGRLVPSGPHDRAGTPAPPTAALETSAAPGGALVALGSAMNVYPRPRIELLLAGIAATAVATFAGCGGVTDGGPGNGTSSSSWTIAPGDTGTTSGANGRPETCDNGKDPLCSCTLPGPMSSAFDYRGPPFDARDAGDAGDAGDGAKPGDGGAWTCEQECSTYHPNYNGTLEGCSFAPQSAPQKVSCNYYVKCVGRRPAGFEEAVLESTAARELLVATAELEQASIDAFVRLARELAHHRAPAALVARAREAAQDERRHARAMRLLAVRFGAEGGASRRRMRPRRVPRLADVLVENAVEGCVRETFGALMAHVQARRASDQAVGHTMARIAVDESRHASLAWDVHAWGIGRLSPHEQHRIDEARRGAVRGLVDEIERGPREVDARELGLVGAIEARALAASLEASLWAEAAPSLG